MRRSGWVIAGVVGVTFACGGSDGDTLRPRKPSAAAKAVPVFGGCHAGKAGIVEIPPDGIYDLPIDVAQSSFVLRATPFSECGGSTSLEYTASFGGGALRVEGSGSTSSSRSGIQWKVVAGGDPGTHFVSFVTTTSPVVDAGPDAGDRGPPASDDDAREFETIATMDSETKSRLVVLNIVKGDDTTYFCVFQLRWSDSDGEYESCADGCGSGGGSSGGLGGGGHDFD